MKTNKFVRITELCQHYQIQIDFFEEIEYHELIEFHQFSGQKFIHRKQLRRLEKIIRLHDDLEINLQGIDVVFSMMNRIEKLEMELNETKKKLNLYKAY